MALTNTDVSALLRENLDGDLVDLVFRRTDLLNFLRGIGAMKMSTGASSFQWDVISAANTSGEIFSEGQSLPVAGKQTYKRAALSPFYARVVCDVSGHVRDNAKGAIVDPWMVELQKGTADLYKKVEDTLVGTTQDQGIQSIIDADDTYAGLAPGSVSTHASKETALAGPQTIAALQDMEEALSTTPYTGLPTHILAAANQISNYVDTVGTGNGTAANRLVRFNRDAGTPGPIDAGMVPMGNYYQPMGLSYNGKVWVPISGLTTTVILMIDATTPIELVIHRDVTVDDLAKVNDGQQAQISMACCLKVKQRNAHGKLTGVTA